MNLLASFDLYRKIGWRVIPVRPRSKLPVGRAWNGNYDPRACREYFAANPDSNMGLLLGGVVDVEADSPNANDILSRLVGDFPHPKYRSSRSVHHLFLCPEGLTRRVVGGIEFRGRLHQSLVPPSVSPGGVRYRWEADSVFPVPPMPPALLRFFRRHTHAGGPNHTSPWCAGCGHRFVAPASEVAAFRLAGAPWRCRGCNRKFKSPAKSAHRFCYDKSCR